MGHATLIYIIGCLLIFGIISLNVHTIVNYGTKASADYYGEQYARNIANSTANMIVERLNDTISWRAASPVTANYLDGKASYLIQDAVLGTDSVIKITVTSTFAGTQRTVVTYTARQAQEVPVFFKKAILSGEEIVVNGEGNRIVDDNNTSWNADMHANKDIILNGADYLQEGFVTYTSSITADWSDATLTPNVNPSGAPVHALAPAVPIPAFVAATYAGIADVVYAGDKTFSGNVVMGTAANPKIIYVTGKAVLEGINVIGHGVLLVGGDVEVTGDIIPDPINPSNSSLGIYTQGKLEVNTANVKVHAQVLAMKDIILNALGIKFHGSITSKKNITFNGQDIQFRYKPANAALTRDFWPAGGRLKKMAHFE